MRPLSHILIVHHDAGARARLKRMLRPAGFTVAGVDSAALALERIAAAAPALILLDIDLPDMTGRELLRRLRSNPAT